MICSTVCVLPPAVCALVSNRQKKLFKSVKWSNHWASASSVEMTIHKTWGRGFEAHSPHIMIVSLLGEKIPTSCRELHGESWLGVSRIVPSRDLTFCEMIHLYMYHSIIILYAHVFTYILSSVICAISLVYDLFHLLTLCRITFRVFIVDYST